MENSNQPIHKDFWDKLSSISQLSAGILVALIGGLFTLVYSNRDSEQKILESRRDKEQKVLESKRDSVQKILEIHTHQLQVLESFVPHLISKNDDENKMAILMISELADSAFAIKVSSIFKSKGTLQAGEIINKSHGMTGQQSKSKEQWVYLGAFDASSGRWNSRYFRDISRFQDPYALKNKILPVSDTISAVNVRASPLGTIINTFPRGTKVKIIEVKDFANTGYIWARVEINN